MILVAVIAITMKTSLAQTERSQPGKPDVTLQESLNWLKGHLPLMTGAAYLSNETGYDTEKWEAESLGNCRLRLMKHQTQRSRYTSERLTFLETYEFFLSDLNPASLDGPKQSITTGRDYFFFEVSTKDGSETIAELSESNGLKADGSENRELYSPPKENRVSSILIGGFGNRQTAQRAADTFRDAMQLCKSAY